MVTTYLQLDFSTNNVNDVWSLWVFTGNVVGKAKVYGSKFLTFILTLFVIRLVNFKVKVLRHYRFAYPTMNHTFAILHSQRFKLITNIKFIMILF